MPTKSNAVLQLGAIAMARNSNGLYGNVPQGLPFKSLSLANCWEEMTEFERGFINGMLPLSTLATLPFTKISDIYPLILHRKAADGLRAKLEKHMSQNEIDFFSPSAGVSQQSPQSLSQGTVFISPKPGLIIAAPAHATIFVSGQGDEWSYVPTTLKIIVGLAAGYMIATAIIYWVF